jgi:hypothetical protein
MQIIGIEDCDFPDLLQVLNNAKKIGSYTKNGKVQMVRACEKFLLIAPTGDTQKIAIKPARNQNEADRLGIQFLNREKLRGSDVEFV